MGQSEAPAAAGHQAKSCIALGTAQFGQRYGVANLSGQVPADAIAAILRLAGSRGIDTIDTAIAYGTSEACLGELGIASWRVVTKLPAVPDFATDIAGWVNTQVRASMARLRVTRLDGLLLHKPCDLHGPHGESLLSAIAELRERDWIGAAGVSIYDPAELDDLWPLWQPEIIQAPASVLDRRLIKSGWLTRLQRHGTRLHVRSAFLQGLLLMPPERRPAYFHRWRDLLDAWSAWCTSQRVSPLGAALGFVCRLPGVERVVVGVDSVAQLQEVLCAAREVAPQPPPDLFSDDRELLEPWRWKLL
jgi:aryl-alcohol dehydrogenase-like predicted oxidoreductase